MSRKGNEKEKTKEGSIKVTDRRLFTLDGKLKGELEPEEMDREEEAAESDASTARTAGAEDAGSAPAEERRDVEGGGFERKPLDEPEGVDFTMLINAMAQPALVFLGEVAHPGTGRPEVDLEQARLQIDLLDTLRIKCRGNLTREEEGLLDRILYQLRMLYVSRSNAPKQ